MYQFHEGVLLDHADIQECVHSCQRCHEVCITTLDHALCRGEFECGVVIRLLLACAEMSKTNAEFLMLGTSFYSKTCELCMEICKKCAEECELHSHDPQWVRCAETCRSCARCCECIVNDEV